MESQGFHAEQVEVQSFVGLNGRSMLVRLLPTLTGLVTEFLITGKVNLKGKDSALMQGVIAVLHELLNQLEAK